MPLNPLASLSYLEQSNSLGNRATASSAAFNSRHRVLGALTFARDQSKPSVYQALEATLQKASKRCITRQGEVTAAALMIMLEIKQSQALASVR